MVSGTVYSEWRRLPGSARRYLNVLTDEEISYREARKRGIVQKAKPEKIPVRYPSVSKERGRDYKNRNKWLKGVWQLEGRYIFERDDGETDRILGWSRNYKVRDLEKQREEAIKWAMSHLSGSGWRFLAIEWERWLRR